MNNIPNTYFLNVINSLILFTSDLDKYKLLDNPTFNFMHEVETEFNIAFNDFSINKIFEANLISLDLRSELYRFKKDISKISNDKWNVEDFFNHKEWKITQDNALQLLNILNIKTRTYIDDYKYIPVNPNKT